MNPSLTVVAGQQPSEYFLAAVRDAHNALARKGIRQITPDAVWEKLAGDARMEGTWTHILAWDDNPAKSSKSYARLIERLIRERKFDGLEIIERRGVAYIEEELPF